MIIINTNLRLILLWIIANFGNASCADDGALAAFEVSHISALRKHGCEVLCRDLFEVTPDKAPNIIDLLRGVSMATGATDVLATSANAIKQREILEAVVFSAINNLNRLSIDDHMSMWVVSRFTYFLNGCGFVEPVRPWFSRVEGVGHNPTQYLFGDAGLVTNAIAVMRTGGTHEPVQFRRMLAFVNMFRDAARGFPRSLAITRSVEIARIESSVSLLYHHQSTSTPLAILEATLLDSEHVRHLTSESRSISRLQRFIDSIPFFVSCFCWCCMPKKPEMDNERTPLLRD